MKSLSKIGLVVSMGVLLSGCTLLPQLGGGGPTSQGGSAEKKTGETTGGGPFDGTLKAAIALGVPMKCNYKVGEEEMTGYIKGKQWRGDIKQNGKEGSVLVKDNCMWTWNKGENQGFKLCFDPKESPQNGGVESGDIWDEAEQVDNEGQYHCVPTLVTEAQFEPPADVNFSSMEDMMQKMMQGEDGAPEAGE